MRVTFGSWLYLDRPRRRLPSAIKAYGHDLTNHDTGTLYLDNAVEEDSDMVIARLGDSPLTLPQRHVSGQLQYQPGLGASGPLGIVDKV